ncbi:DUF3492 domain-containing protein [Streptomyces sp. SID8379]|uniref:DUF3492 domain-containing protein n=1 Tax=unclassified Streptomyces TaxID=2593676 RepID=UPI000686B133|nr:DUF3492 domain-containing protein [Streptomyces sp. HmicA12]MYW67380.1 DUF3492 domain-containing protein [Streptomyces sp. SID8379]
MRIGLLTEGGYPYVSGEARLWCDRLVRGLEQHEFDIYALSRSQEQEDAGWLELPPQVSRVRTAPMWTTWAGSGEAGVRDGALGRRARRRFATLYGELVGAVVCGSGDGAGAAGFFGSASDGGEGAGGGLGFSEADRFASALYGLAELARDEGGLGSALRSETAVRILERACRAPGALRAARAARVPDLLAFAGEVECALRPLSLDWYDDPSVGSSGGSSSGSFGGSFGGSTGGGGLGAVDLCHATSGGAAALPGLVAKRFFGVPLLVTEYGVQLRARYIAAGDAELSAPVRALLAAFHGRLAAEVYRQAAVITPGNAHARRWQERCGADRAKLRTVHPGMEATRFAEVGEREEPGDPDTLVWVGRIDPSKDLISLLHAFAEVRKEEPKARLRIVGALPAATGPGGDQEAEAYLGHCKGLAAQLFPDEAEGIHAVGENPVSFEELGGPEAIDLADVYGSGSIVVLSSVVEGFPISLVEAMFCGRATVSTDVGAVVEVIGGTGLVVPPRNPRALAEACVSLLRDPERRERLGAAARARALELFTVEQNVTAFRGIYLEIVSHCPVRREAVDDAGEPVPFSHPPEAHVPGRWTAPGTGGGGSWLVGRSTGAGTPSWASDDAAGGGAREELAGATRGGGESDA